jgi:hypothetical protein
MLSQTSIMHENGSLGLAGVFINFPSPCQFASCVESTAYFLRTFQCSLLVLDGTFTVRTAGEKLSRPKETDDIENVLQLT